MIEEIELYDKQIARWHTWLDWQMEPLQDYYIAMADTYLVLGHPRRFTDSRGRANSIAGVRDISPEPIEYYKDFAGGPGLKRPS